MSSEDNNEKNITDIENKIFINGVALSLRYGDNQICRCQIRCCDPAVALDEILKINIPIKNKESVLRVMYVRHELDEKVMIRRSEYREVAMSERLINLNFCGEAKIQLVKNKLVVRPDDSTFKYNDFEITEEMKKSKQYTLSKGDSILLQDGSEITFFKEKEIKWEWEDDEWT